MNSRLPVSLCVVALLAVAGCSGSGGPASTPPAVRSISVSYVPSDSAPAVAVAVSHPQPLVSVELVAPDGRTAAASLIERDAPRSSPSVAPTVGVGVFGGSGGGGIGTGLGLGFPLGGSAAPPPAAGHGARARVVIPDPAAYRRDWPNTVVRLRFGAAPEPVTVADIPAPEPR